VSSRVKTVEGDREVLRVWWQETELHHPGVQDVRVACLDG
jgi:hypothetical protein